MRRTTETRTEYDVLIEGKSVNSYPITDLELSKRKFQAWSNWNPDNDARLVKREVTVETYIGEWDELQVQVGRQPGRETETVQDAPGSAQPGT